MKALGTGATLAISSDGVTYVPIAKVKKIDQTATVAMVDATDNDSNGTKEKLPADSEFKLSCTANYDSSDTGQKNAIAACFAKSLMYVRYRPRVASGEDQYIGAAYLSKAQVPSQHASIQELMFDVEFTGGSTRSAQP